MAIYHEIVCPECDGNGFISKCEITEFGGSAWSEKCCKCDGTGYIKVPMTNNDRINALRTPEEKLRFIRGFQQWSRYLGTLFDVVDLDTDEGLLLWLNKISDDSDNLIFGSEE